MWPDYKLADCGQSLALIRRNVDGSERVEAEEGGRMLAEEGGMKQAEGGVRTATEGGVRTATEGGVRTATEVGRRMTEAEGGRVLLDGRGPHVTLRCDCNKSNGLDAKCKCTTPLRRTHALTLTNDDAADDGYAAPTRVDPRRRGRRYATDVNTKYWAKCNQGAVTLAGDTSATYRASYRPRLNAAQQWYANGVDGTYQGSPAPHWMDYPDTPNYVGLPDPEPRERLVIRNNNAPGTNPQDASSMQRGQPSVSPPCPQHGQSAVPAMPARERAHHPTYIGVVCDAAGQPQPLMDTQTRGVGQSQPLIDTQTRGVGQSQPLIDTQTRGVGQSQPLMDTQTRGVGQSQPLMDTQTRGVDQSPPCVETRLHVPMLPYGQQTVTCQPEDHVGVMRYNFASQAKSSVETPPAVRASPYWSEFDCNQSQASLPTDTRETPVKKVGSVSRVHRGYDYGVQEYKAVPDQAQTSRTPREGNADRREEEVPRCAYEKVTCLASSRQSPAGEASSRVPTQQGEHAQSPRPGPGPRAPGRAAPHCPQHAYQV